MQKLIFLGWFLWWMSSHNALTVAGPSGKGQEPSSPRQPKSVLDISKKFSDSNRFLMAYEEIKKYVPANRQDEWLKRQMQITYASFLGGHPDYAELLQFFEPRVERDSLYDAIAAHAVWDDDAIRRILELARRYRIIMFNENHFQPQHRVLLYRLLPELQRLGFRYLALEALFSEDEINAPDGFPTLQSGFYTREQHYGRLLRRAKALGFRFVSYDHFKNPAERETAQADNIYKKTFAADPEAKVVVLAGIAHIWEKPVRGKKWMAAVFKEKYGIDPLTISQTGVSRYRRLFEHELGLIEAQRLPSPRLHNVNLQLLNHIRVDPREEAAANFSFRNTFRFPIQLNLFLQSELKDASDLNDKIPWRVTYLAPGAGVQWRLPAEEYRLVAFDRAGAVVLSRPLSINKEGTPE